MGVYKKNVAVRIEERTYESEESEENAEEFEPAYASGEG
jgi:hypothetical protein